MHVRDQIRDDDAGEMLLLMAGLTAMLLGVAGLLLWTLGQPLASTSTEVNQDAALAGALTLRSQALSAGLRADAIGPGVSGLDVDSACAAAAAAAAAHEAQMSGCWLSDATLTVITRWRPERMVEADQSPRTGGVTLVDAEISCLRLNTSWGETLPARCAEIGSDTMGG